MTRTPVGPVLLLAVLSCSLAEGRVFRVGAGASVQAALDKARPGDWVLLAAGVYTQRIQVARQVRIWGAGMDRTILDGGASGPVVRITSRGPVVLGNLTIRNGRVQAGPCRDARGGGVRNASAVLVLIRVRIAGNEVQGGAAVAAPGGAAYGGGVFSEGPLWAYDCRIQENRAVGGSQEAYDPDPSHTPFGGSAYGGGVFVARPARLVRCVFESNYCRVGREYYGYIHGAAVGAGIYAPSGGVFAAQCLFEGNSLHPPDGRFLPPPVRSGGAGFAQGGGLSVLARCQFARNRGAWGGAVLNDGDGKVKLTACRFEANEAWCGAGLFNGDRAYAHVEDCELVAGAAQTGGGIFNSGDAVLVGGIVASNDVGYAPPGGGWDTRGGGIASQGRIWVRGTRLEGNVAHYGGAIFAAGETYMEGSSLERNLAVLGAGAWVDESNGFLRASECLFARNFACGTHEGVLRGHPATWPGKGGAIFNFGTVELAGCAFLENQAYGYTLWLYRGGAFGGALLNEGTAQVARCCFVSNEVWGWSGFVGAYHDGGAICNYGSIELLDSVFCHNMARGYTPYGDPRLTGGALANWGYAQVGSCTFAGNELCWFGAYQTYTSKGASVYAEGILEMASTVVCDDEGQSARGLSGRIFSRGWNLIEDASDVWIENARESDWLGLDARVGPVVVAGPGSSAILLARDSPALDRGVAHGAADARGFDRPFDLSWQPNAADGADIGATEMAECDALVALEHVENLMSNRMCCVLRLWNVGLCDLESIRVALFCPQGWDLVSWEPAALVGSSGRRMWLEMGALPSCESRDMALVFEKTGTQGGRGHALARVYTRPEDQFPRNNSMAFLLPSNL